MPPRILSFLQQHLFATFIVMGLAFFVFGLLSLNLVYLLKSNIELFLDYGTMALFDGGLRQLFELLLSGYLGLAFYLLFKACEKILVERLVATGKQPIV